jgi:type VI secretion system protein ImpI
VRVDDLKTGASKQYAFDKSPVRIGRNPMNDVVIDAPFISQWHGLVRFDEATTEYMDLGSTNGTLANGDKMEQKVPLQVAGNTELRVLSVRFFCWRDFPENPAAISRPSMKSLGPWSSLVLDADKRAQAIARGGASLAVKQAKPLYDAYREAWSKLIKGIHDSLDGLPERAQAETLARLQHDMPELAGEEEFRALAERHQVVAVTGAAPMSSGAARLVEEFARSLVPGLSLRSLADIEKLLARAATTLETSARAFVELRKGQDEFGNEMGVRTANAVTALHQSQDPARVLAYLLDPGADVNQRIQELTSAYADIMVHQVALLNGIMEGVRSLLKKLGPTEIEQEVEQSVAAFSRTMAPYKARWQRFVERHRELSEEERELSAAVFGPEFARAYSEMIRHTPDADQGKRR